MVDFVYRDQDYRQFVCGDIDCGSGEFEACLEFRREPLHDKPPLVGFFVEPARKAENFYTGFFILHEGKLIPQMVFFGAGIGSNQQRTDAQGYKIVRGSERRTPVQWVDYDFGWDGSRYRQLRETTRPAK